MKILSLDKAMIPLEEASNDYYPLPLPNTMVLGLSFRQSSGLDP